MSDESTQPISSADRLMALAELLEVTTEELFSSPPPVDDESLTLLRLWSEIRDPQGRGRVLNLAREEAERSGDHDPQMISARER